MMKKFVKQGWVRRRAEAGQRGQTRAVYSLTVLGNREIFRRLNQFGEKEAGSATEFRLRVGLFHLLTPQARKRILAQRERWLAAREERFAMMRESLKAIETSWSMEVLAFLQEEVHAERRWIGALEKKDAQLAGSGASSKKAIRR